MIAGCISLAAEAYTVPVSAIETVIDRPGIGGIGPMGIPPAWLPILARIGFSAGQVRSDACANVAAGAWIIAYEKLESGGTAPASPSSVPFSIPAEIAGDVSAACIQKAADTYSVPVTLLRGILATEGGHVGQVHWNNNGTYDIGPAQINSTWLPKLASQGITRNRLLNDGCLNISVGAWILAQDMQGADPNRPAQFWQHVGTYNSATPYYNQRYAALVWQHISDTELAK
jgi:hypothetical protein